MSAASTSPAVVEVEAVWRRYRVAKRPRSLRASITQDPLRRQTDRWLWALKGVDLDVRRGEAVGLLGHNGAGKSTLLRLIGGVGRPDRGTLRVDGRIGALVDLGHELHSDLTGRQNVEISAVIAGLTRREALHRFADIIEFAELADFVDEPLRAYSDGMRARLAFSVMAHLSPDVLLVDEALSVGDAAFQRRAVERIESLRSEGVAIVIVSHDLALLRRVCERAVWLDHGRVEASGLPQDVVAGYLERSFGGSELPLRARGAKHLIREVRALDAWRSPTTSLETGAGLIVDIDLDVSVSRGSPLLRVRIVRVETDTVVVDTSTPIDEGGERTQQVAFERLELAPGDHRLEVTVHAPGWAALIDEIEPLPLEIRGQGPRTALLDPPHRWARADTVAGTGPLG